MLAPALGVVVAGHRIELSVSRRRQAARVDTAGDEELHDLDGTGRGPLPVRGEARVLNGNVVGVAGHLEVPAVNGLQDLSDLRYRVSSGRLEARLPGVEEDVVRKLEDEPTISGRKIGRAACGGRG